MSEQLTFKIIDGDLIIDELKRVPTITGSQKPGQDIFVLLKTHLGEDIFHPDTGFDIVSIVQSDYDEDLIRLEVLKALQQYPYLESVDEIIVHPPDSDRKVVVDIRITLLTKEEYELGVTL